MIWFAAHAIGYLSLAYVGAGASLRWLLSTRDRRRARRAVHRAARIARLELSTGVGLVYGRDWLLSQPIACDWIFADLAAKGNWAVERKCWGCDVSYKPRPEYGGEQDDRELKDRLCPRCYSAAKVDLGDMILAGPPG